MFSDASDGGRMGLTDGRERSEILLSSVKRLTSKRSNEKIYLSFASDVDSLARV